MKALLLVLGCLVLSVCAAETLENEFTNFPETTRPWAYWYWMNGNISESGITADLEAAKEAGIACLFIADIYRDEVPNGAVVTFSDAWWSALKHAASEAERLDLKLGFFNSPGWSNSGGPWVSEEDAMKYVDWVEERVEGGQVLDIDLAYDEWCETIAVLAFPTPMGEGVSGSDYGLEVSKDGVACVELTDGSTATGLNWTGDISLFLDVEDGFVARSLELLPFEKTFRCSGKLYVEDMGGGSTLVKEFILDRRSYMDAVGIRAYGPLVLSLPSLEGRHYRLDLEVMDGKISLSEVGLSGACRLDYYEEKQLRRLYPTYQPKGDAYLWDAVAEPTDQDCVIDPDTVLDLSAYLGEDQHLVWDAPEGGWTVVRFVMALTGMTNHPASDEGKGLEVDRFDAGAVRRHFEAYTGEYLSRLTEAENAVMTHVVSDSYETGAANWGDDFVTRFSSVYGYDVLPYLPVFTGRCVESMDVSDRFLWDLRRLVADLLASEYIGTMHTAADDAGKVLWMENYGHWGYPGEFLLHGGKGNQVSGELWTESPLGDIEVRAAASAAHTYGKPEVFCEAFTSGNLYKATPGNLRARGDWATTEGMNHMVYHFMVHQPDDRMPGVTPGFSTEFNRHNTWFSELGDWSRYWARTHRLMQEGSPVADLAYFIGEDAPRMTGELEPAVPEGYDYDFINADVLLHHSSVVDGRLELDSGASYALLVLPERETMRPELIHRLEDLVNEGLSIYGPASVRSPSLQGYPLADSAVLEAAERLWGEGVNGNDPLSREVGKGHVFHNMELDAVFEVLGVEPDLISNRDGIAWAHRHSEERDVYFLSNQEAVAQRLVVSPRVGSGKPELWDAVSGKVYDIDKYVVRDGRYQLELMVEAEQSLLVVFERNEGLIEHGALSELTGPKWVQQAIEGAWEVTFESMLGESFSRTFSELTDWASSDDAAIQGFSGSASYEVSFNVNTVVDGARYFFVFDQVSDLARVSLNGSSLGLVWSAPWEVEVTDALEEGMNELQVQVTNTWRNRLIADSELAEEERETYYTFNTRIKPTTVPSPGGLVGHAYLAVGLDHLDTDLDGRSDYFEMVSGEDLLLADERFSYDVREWKAENGKRWLRFTYSAQAGRTYRLEYRSGMDWSEDWSVVDASEVTEAVGVGGFDVPLDEAAYGFFRIVVVFEK